MKIAFLTEMGFFGKIPHDHPNMRTEFAWMHALDADHVCIHQYKEVIDYDNIFIIFPKGKTFLNSEGSKLIDSPNPVSSLLSCNIVDALKRQGNKKVHYVQEGPHWWWNDYEIADQINFYNLLTQCDSIFAHNEYDLKYYRGLIHEKKVEVIPTLMIEDFASSLNPSKQEKVIIGGNFARWYGGFESYIIANEFKVPIYAQTSHAKRKDEEHLDNLIHFPRFYWNDWMNALKDFKYAVHLMPTVAAGTFSLNCAYFGIPCIGNKKVDTQKICHPDISVDVEDLEGAKKLAIKLREDKDFYQHCSSTSKNNYQKYFSVEVWKNRMQKII